MKRPQPADRPPALGRQLLLSGARSLTVVVLSVVVYYLLPLEHGLDAGGAIALAVSLVLFAGMLAWQIRAITRSAYPRLRAIETLATAGPVFLLIFSTAYVLLYRSQGDSFSETLNRTDALYFAITVFSTVGFGDITPTTGTARILTMVQMLAGLVLVGLIARIVLGALRVTQEGRSTDAGSTDRPEDRE